MTEKKATPERIEWQREFSNNYGVFHVFEIQFDDGTVGEFSTTKKEDQIKFKVGEEVLYTTTEKTDGQGNVYNKIDKPKQDGEKPGSGGSGRGGYSGRKDPVKDRSIIANVSIMVANRLIINNDKADLVDDSLTGLLTMADKVYNHILNASKGNTQLSITVQAQVKIVSEYFFNYPNVTMDTSSQALAYADKLVEWVLNKAKG